MRGCSQRCSLSRLKGEGKPTSEPDDRVKEIQWHGLLPLGSVFLVLALGMIFLGNTAWIAFFAMSVTFLILGLQNRTGEDKRPPSGASQG